MKNFREQYLDARIAQAIAKSLDRVDGEKRLARSSGAAKPGQEDSRPDRRPGAPVTRRIDPLPHGPARPTPASTYKAPDEPHFHVEMERGAPVKVKVDGELHHGKIEDWNDETGGVRVRTHAGVVHGKRHHLRPLTEDDLRRHREEQDADQEQRGRVAMRYSSLDLAPGMRVTAVDDDDNEVTGRIASVSHTYPQHVVLRTHEHGKFRLSVHPLEHVRQVHEDLP